MTTLPPSSEIAWLHSWSRLARRLRQELSSRYARTGLSESRALVLEALSESPSPSTQADLAAALCLSESNLCALIERMRQEGLLQRERSTIDRRKTLLTVTAKGRAGCDEITHINARLGAELLTQVSVDFPEQLEHCFDTLLNALNALQAAEVSARRCA